MNTQHNRVVSLLLLLDAELDLDGRAGLLGEADAQHAVAELRVGLVPVTMRGQTNGTLELTSFAFASVNVLSVFWTALTFGFHDQLIIIDRNVEICMKRGMCVVEVRKA